MRRQLAVAVPVAALLALAGCGGSSSPSPSTSSTPPASTSSSPAPAASASGPADPAAAKAEITSVWEKFFNSGTPLSEAKNLLEDGANLKAALLVAAREDRQTHLNRVAKVKLINFISPTTANVTWRLLNGTKPLLDNASGQAVLINGHWLVSKLTFCTLVELGNNGKPVPGCS